MKESQKPYVFYGLFSYRLWQIFVVYLIMVFCFRDGEIKTNGTDITDLLPPVSRFGGGGGNREKKKQTVIDRLKAFFERFFGIGA